MNAKDRKKADIEARLAAGKGMLKWDSKKKKIVFATYKLTADQEKAIELEVEQEIAAAETAMAAERRKYPKPVKASTARALSPSEKARRRHRELVIELKGFLWDGLLLPQLEEIYVLLPKGKVPPKRK
jgi:hypothetical protein